MADTLEFTLNNPLTEEQWDMITDVDFDHTDRIWFHTKHGKEVEFAKVIRCKDCKHREWDVIDVIYGQTKRIDWCNIRFNADGENVEVAPNDFCSLAERKTDNG